MGDGTQLGGVGGDGEILYSGKPNCCGAPGQWCKNTKWLITTSYIEREAGICCTSIDNLQLIRVKDISYKAKCCCGCCGCIHIMSTDTSTPELFVCGIPDGREIYGRLRNAITALHGNAKLEIDI
mmetsp:Transcript_7035/g.16956  ORF Transcript_7035/g.16956 Transcript_7035/m.16956 type:complete len:125 (-) Transcript_7035:118-492(-)